MKCLVLSSVFIWLGILTNPIQSQDSPGQVRISEIDTVILTHQLVPAGPVPSAFDPNGIYPYPSYSETADRPVPVKYHFVVLENVRLRITICPDLGGKVTSMVLKPSGKEVLYVPEVIRPVRILPRFYFVAGGIEVSFPVSHSPVQNDKLLYRIEESGSRAYVTCGERELRFGMQWSVEYSLGPTDEFLTERVIYHNPGKNSCPWMSWSNAALPAAADTRFDYPDGTVLSHSSVLDTIDWKSQGPSLEADIKEMTGYFWKTRDADAFGAFTPSLGTGLYHVAEGSVAPGMKLWSYGMGPDSAWSTLSTAKHQRYIEIQGGPIGDQSVKLELGPGETRLHTEFWFPSETPLDIHTLQVPPIRLRPPEDIPPFGWARPGETGPWEALKVASIDGGKVPEPPEVEASCWPPSGMEDLETAFLWANRKSSPGTADTWEYYYGTWLAGRGDTARAIRELSGSSLGMAKALLGRLLRITGNSRGAVRAYDSIRERWLQLHPQVVIERDKALRDLGPETLAIREAWLSQVEALQDEGIIERRVRLLIDKGDPAAAKALLLSVTFQKVHQTYTRTSLWFQICDLLGEPRYPIPLSLGEDRLASFGAYREFNSE